MSKLSNGKFEINEPQVIKDLYMGAIQAGNSPSATSILIANEAAIGGMIPAKHGRLFNKVDSIELVFDPMNSASSLPTKIIVEYSYTAPKDIQLTIPVSRQIASQWDTARVGALLEQILDQLKIGNTSSLRTTVLEPISKLAAQGITADANELQSLSMEVASLKSANAIYEVENGRLLTALNDERSQHELDLRKEKAKTKSYQEQFAGLRTASASPVASYLALEDDDRFLARRVLLAAEARFGDLFVRKEGTPDYKLCDLDVERQIDSIQMYIHVLCDALLSARTQQKVTLQMVKSAKSKAMQTDKHAVIAVDEKFGFDSSIGCNDIHPEAYEPYFLALTAVYEKPTLAIGIPR